MTKQNFLTELRQKLSGVPQSEIEECLKFYSEIIDDKIEDGTAEEDVIKEIGNIDDIVAQTLSEIPLSAIVKEKAKTRRKLRAWEIVLLAVGSPIWASLLIAVFAVLISVYAAIWSVVVSIWAVDVSFAASALGGIAAGVLSIVTGNVASGVFIIGAAIAPLPLKAYT